MDYNIDLISLGGFAPPSPLQGIVLTEIVEGIYSCTATTIMTDFEPESIGDGVSCWSSSAKDIEFVEQLSIHQIRSFAKHYDGVCIKRPSNKGWIIKGIAPKMRLAIENEVNK